jgi:threonine dehydratase
MPLVTLADITAAQMGLRGVATRTPLIRFVDPDPAAAFHLKAESLQPIGSFKLRGAYNKIASLTKEERGRGVITYSSGNHAQGVAYAARALGSRAIIVMPSNAPQVKVDATRALGAEIVVVGPASSDRQKKAEELAAQHGYVVIPPFNDEKIIAGQGTVGLEILEDMPDVDLVLVPIGGGGQLSGIAAAIKLSGSRAKVIGVEPTVSNDAQQSFRAGKVVAIPAEQASSTLADGLRTQAIGAMNLEHLRAFVDDVVTVSEQEIREALRRLLFQGHVLAEPSGAVASAAYFFHRGELPAAKKAVAVVSGGNIEPKVLREILSDASQVAAG